MRSLFFLSLLVLPCVLRGQEKVTYQDHVRPVFENRCLNCHNPDKKKGGLDLSTYATTMAGGSGGLSVDAGEANSLLLQCITFAKEPNMPPKGDKIPAPEIELITKWIVGGLLDSAGSTAKVKKKQNFAMAATGNPLVKPDGPPPMPEQLLLDPVVESPRADAIVSLAHSPWAPLVAMASVRQVLLYHAETGALLGVLPFPEGSPKCVGFSRNGSVVYAGGGKSGKKGLVVLWDVKTGKRITTVGEEMDEVLACDLTPDHKLVALGGPGRKVKIYQTATGQCVTTIKKHTDWVMACAFSPDGVLLATGDRTGGLYVWETATGNEFYNLKGHEKALHAITWRADSNVVASASEDGTIRWWEMGGGSNIKNYPGAGGAAVLALAYAADGRLVSGGRDGRVRIWAADGNQQREFVPAGGAMVTQVGWTPDGGRCLTGAFNGEVKFWDAVKEAKEAPPLAIVANPPAIATRLISLQQELTSKQTSAQQAAAAAHEQAQAVSAAEAAAEEMKKQIAHMQEEQKKTADIKGQLQVALGKLGTTKGKYQADLADAEKQLAALSLPPAASGPAPAGMPEPVNTALQQANQAQDAAVEISKTLTEAKIKDLREIISKHETEITSMTARIPQAEQQMQAMVGQVTELEKAMPLKTAAIEAAQKLAAEAKAAVAAATGAVQSAQQTINQWLAAREMKTVVLSRTELEELKDVIEALKAEAAPLEEATKAPGEEKLLQEKRDRLSAVKTELAKHETRQAELQKAADTALQSIQALQPKQG